MEAKNIFLLIGHGLMATFTACAKWLNQRHTEKLITLFGEAFVALAGGVLTHFFFFGYLAWDVNLCFVIAGLVGWGGSKAISELGKYVAKIKGIGLSEKENEKGGEGV